MPEEIPPEITQPQTGHVLTNSDILVGKRIPPVKAVKTYDSSEFELFIQEWADGYLREKNIYNYVGRYGGAGDKGRDVVAFTDEEKKIADYYQCKHYDHALSPTHIWAEIGKLCFHTFTGEILFPRKYYFVAPRDLGPKLATLLNGDQSKLRSELIKNWKKHCEKNITDKSAVPLEGALADYVSKMDFSIFNTKPIMEIITEHAQTRWYPSRFGGGLRPRQKTAVTPEIIADHENLYVEKLLDAYSDKVKNELKSAKDLESLPEELAHFSRQRNAFYSAEALRIYARESLPQKNDGIEKLKEDTHNFVINTHNANHENGVEKINAVTDRAMEMPTTGNILADQICILDKHGICHHLANEDKLTWASKLKHE